MQLKLYLIVILLFINLFSQFAIVDGSIEKSVNDRVTGYIIIPILLLYLSLSSAISFSRNIGRIKSKQVKFAEGNINVEMRKSYSNDELGDIEKNLDKMAGNLSSVIRAVLITSTKLAGISEMLAAGTEEASASISEVEMTVKEINRSANKQSSFISQVNEKLERHLLEVQKISQEIFFASTSVVKVASRTNILALNASIEAAKAGKAGKGFNIVATQVRDLSKDAKSSASSITEQVEEINYNLKSNVDNILEEVRGIRKIAEETALGASEADSSTSEQVLMLSEISETSNELSDLAKNMQVLLAELNVIKAEN